MGTPGRDSEHTDGKRARSPPKWNSRWRKQWPNLTFEDVVKFTMLPITGLNASH